MNYESLLWVCGTMWHYQNQACMSHEWHYVALSKSSMRFCKKRPWHRVSDYDYDYDSYDDSDWTMAHGPYGSSSSDLHGGGIRYTVYGIWCGCGVECGVWCDRMLDTRYCEWMHHMIFIDAWSNIKRSNQISLASPPHQHHGQGLQNQRCHRPSLPMNQKEAEACHTPMPTPVWTQQHPQRLSTSTGLVCWVFWTWKCGDTGWSNGLQLPVEAVLCVQHSPKLHQPHIRWSRPKTSQNCQPTCQCHDSRDMSPQSRVHMVMVWYRPIALDLDFVYVSSFKYQYQCQCQYQCQSLLNWHRERERDRNCDWFTVYSYTTTAIAKIWSASKVPKLTLPPRPVCRLAAQSLAAVFLAKSKDPCSIAVCLQHLAARLKLEVGEASFAQQYPMPFAKWSM